MNQVIDNILTRYSCREFLDKEIPDKELNEILKAAIYAPTAMNTQRWMFTVIKNRKIIQNLAKVMEKALDRQDYNLYEPQILIIPSTPKDLPYGCDDNACAMENIFLAANSFGIGTCWINQMRLIVDDPEVRKVLTEFGIPEENTVYGMVALGYPKNQEHKEIKRVGIITYIE